MLEERRRDGGEGYNGSSRPVLPSVDGVGLQEEERHGHALALQEREGNISFGVARFCVFFSFAKAVAIPHKYNNV